jgi:phospho-N-acetylmuramoyl-pentapeptide-transferase
VRWLGFFGTTLIQLRFLWVSITGSLTIGGIIAVLSYCGTKRVVIPAIMWDILVENLSVVLQVGYFKYTRNVLAKAEESFNVTAAPPL